MLAQEVIRTKRDGAALDGAQIDAFVRGLADGSWSEGQAAAMAMALYLRGMTGAETVALTKAMTQSGTQLDWAALDLPGPVLDKHSTGGVGDKLSLLLAPIVAACGGFVPMISGRGLGHTGGTLDKLDSIPGYRTTVTLDELRAAVRSVGCAIVGATDQLAPADRRLYAIRDVTATVESIPLITASILSKKLAAGLQGLVMDVKLGNGAFAAEPAMAQALAHSLVTVAQGAGLPTRAHITDMNQVLGRSCGNALEVHEALRFLRGEEREPRLLELTRTLAADMLSIGGIEPQLGAARQRIDRVLDNGRALEQFARMVSALGGPVDFIERADHHLPKAPVERVVSARRDGFVEHVATREIGLLVVALGGGRRRSDDRIDHRVGLSEVIGLGRAVAAGDVLAVVHAAAEAAADAACEQLHGLIQIGDQPPRMTPLLIDRLAG